MAANNVAKEVYRMALWYDKDLVDSWKCSRIRFIVDNISVETCGSWYSVSDSVQSQDHLFINGLPTVYQQDVAQLQCH